MNKHKELCPICRYEIEHCQCMYDHGIDHDDRRRVVFTHLYLLTPAQVKHIIKLQERQNESYSDAERNSIHEELQSAHDGRAKADNWWEKYFDGICPYTDLECEFDSNCKHCRVELEQSMFTTILEQECKKDAEQS